MRDRKSDQHTKNLPIKPGQVRDHIDTNKHNNNPANLRVMDRGAHTSMHNRKPHRTLAKLTKALTMHLRKEKSY